MFIGNVILVCVEGDSGEICWMFYKLSNSTKLCVNIPQLKWLFMYNVLDIAGSSFSCNLVFYMEVVFVVLYTDNPVTNSPFLIPFSWLLGFFLTYTLSPILKLGGVHFVVFCACLYLFSSKVSLAMESAMWCDLMSKCQDSGSSRNH